MPGADDETIALLFGGQLSVTQPNREWIYDKEQELLELRHKLIVAEAAHERTKTRCACCHGRAMTC